MITLILAVGTTGALLVMLAIALGNLWAFPRLSPTSATAPMARVSVLIPARDEAAVIGRTVDALLGQEPPVHEVLVLDDGSTDGTGGAAHAAAGADPRLRVLDGAPLPAGWVGKNWACHQLGQAATGDVLLFTDADVCWEAGALSAVIRLQASLDADLLTVWPTQATVTWGERLVVPL
ncbi:MAG: glycosyltransferase family 2 protein, partial [Caldilineaceae bacterium]|nr:glycosyltransferase family 2 protein [Caldilineaceae bacterium]